MTFSGSFNAHKTHSTHNTNSSSESVHSTIFSSYRAHSTSGSSPAVANTVLKISYVVHTVPQHLQWHSCSLQPPRMNHRMLTALLDLPTLFTNPTAAHKLLTTLLVAHIVFKKNHISSQSVTNNTRSIYSTQNNTSVPPQKKVLITLPLLLTALTTPSVGHCSQNRKWLI